MSADWVIFLEGDGDDRLIRCLLRHLDVANTDTAVIGGGVSKLSKVAPQIHRSHDEGCRVAVLLDANCDFGNRREEYLTKVDELELPVERFFLLPNHRDPGSLEILLEEMAVPEHRLVYECFDEYEACLQKHDTYERPDPKGRIYAYCEALGIETHAAKRDYSDSSFWDLDTPALEPLKQFLVGLQAEVEGA